MRYWDVSYVRTGWYHAVVSLKRSVVIQYHYHYRVRHDVCVCVCVSYLAAAPPHLAVPSENVMANCVKWPQSSPHIDGSLVASICVLAFILGVFNFS